MFFKAGSPLLVLSHHYISISASHLHKTNRYKMNTIQYAVITGIIADYMYVRAK